MVFVKVTPWSTRRDLSRGMVASAVASRSSRMTRTMLGLLAGVGEAEGDGPGSGPPPPPQFERNAVRASTASGARARSMSNGHHRGCIFLVIPLSPHFGGHESRLYHAQGRGGSAAPSTASVEK